jgi:hypothetical protein
MFSANDLVNAQNTVSSIKGEFSAAQKALSDEFTRRMAELEGMYLPQIQAAEHQAKVIQFAIDPASVVREMQAGLRTPVQPGGIQAKILEVFNRQPTLVFNTDMVLLKLQEAGWATNSKDPKSVLAIALSALVKENKIQRVSHGHYSL